MRPFRFGLLVERFSDPGYVKQIAARAEADGFSTLLIRDHLIEPPFGNQYAPWITLASVAQTTSTLRLGTLVVANDFRHPAVLAKEVTTLDQFSNGRVELGLGAGFFREEFERAGLTFLSNRVRVDRLAESVQIFDQLLQGQPLSYRGEHYTFDNYVNFPPSLQTPRPPLLVAGAGPRVLSIAAKHADIVALLSSPLGGGVLEDSAAARSAEHVAQQVQTVREAAGDRFASLELSMFPTLVQTTDRHHAAMDLARQRGWDLTHADALDMPTVLVGTTDQIVDDLRRWRASLGVSYIVLRDGQLEAAAPVVRRLAGER
jgi:probable F420-dependent oxidoreductase